MSTHERTSKVWLITGAGRGFGRQWAKAALERGDRVAATARDIDSLEDLRTRFGGAVLPIALDVCDREACLAAVQTAAGHFDQLDVVVNNAGYGHFGMAEELSESDLRDQLETNFFGAVWVTQAALPIMREQGRGHIIQVSSIGGITAFADLSAYHASKWALEGFSQGLALEVKEFGIAVTIVEPGPFSTDWAGASARKSAPLPAYTEAHARRDEQRARGTSGDPTATRAAMLRLVDSAEPPLRIFFGTGLIEIVAADYGRRMDTWRASSAIYSA